jgi:ubiquitin thioesterase OTU1
MPLTLKVNALGGSHILKGLPDALTLAELQAKISEVTGLAPEAQRIKAGFPPKELAMGDAGAEVVSLGIASGSAVTVSAKEGGGVPSSATAAGGKAADSPLVQQLVDMGFSAGVARKALEMADDNVEAAFELCIGGVVTEESLGAAPASASSSASSGPAPTALANGHVMVRRVIDADNSCLFNAIGYLMEKDRKVGAKLRKIIAVRPPRVPVPVPGPMCLGLCLCLARFVGRLTRLGSISTRST